MKNLLLLLVTVSLASCGIYSKNAVSRSYVQLSRDYLLTVAKNDNFEASALGWGKSGAKGEFIFSLEKEGKYSLEEVRIMLVSKTEQLLKMLNEREELRHEMYKYPADLDSIKLDLAFYLKGYKLYPEPMIVFVFISKGNIVYSATQYAGFENMERFHKETYEFALEWVKDNAPWALDFN